MHAHAKEALSSLHVKPQKIHKGVCAQTAQCLEKASDCSDPIRRTSTHALCSPYSSAVISALVNRHAADTQRSRSRALPGWARSHRTIASVRHPSLSPFSTHPLKTSSYHPGHRYRIQVHLPTRSISRPHSHGPHLHRRSCSILPTREGGEVACDSVESC